ncbi:hypothetical protein BDV96DRAFT_587524 [Lophiotrema nucula]|uniref:Uncharacterized protein n=1 Tax=Lophiotrema nucula TaxID=690887 RepID=A0A6A5YMC5_9PLEO|nr:hypothetical protein BDV96DRAFT_587524 [Lophiotrema nucula]
MARRTESEGFLEREHEDRNQKKNEDNYSRDCSIDSPARTSSQSPKYLTFGLLALSIYSTVISGLFLCVAIIGPKYGHIISERGAFSPSGATLLTAFIAKTIEISFITVYLTFIGQIITRRAMNERSVTLASMTMRSWVLQPGTVITQWEAVRHKGFTLLGLLSLLATMNSLLYTTSSGALVQPQIRVPPWSHKILSGAVRTMQFNINDMQDQCLQAWPSYDDPEYAGSTCIIVKFASKCYHAYENYLSRWSIGDLASTPHDQNHRLHIIGSLDENTTIIPAWIEHTDVQEASSRWGRIVNNVTLAIPHRGIPETARDRRNDLLQPTDLFGSGSYSVHASVPALALQSVCINANREELAPIVYETWPNTNISELPDGTTDSLLSTNNKTALDDVFDWRDIQLDDWNNEQKPWSRARPVFFKFPIPGNTILNHTASRYGRSEAYVLGRHPDRNRTDYFLCSLKMQTTSICSTRYNASTSGQTLEVLCDEQHKAMAYKSSSPESLDFIDVVDWFTPAFDVLNAMSLNTGMIDGNGSLPRTFTSLQLQEPRLNDSLPSPAEALVSMGLCTALDLIQGVPFVDFWNYTSISLGKEQYQNFNASVQVSQYMSGGTLTYQKGFFVILASVFLMNLLIFTYFAVIAQVGFITDICEPLVLFLLGYHSLADDLFDEGAGIRPQKKSYAVPWLVKKRYGQLVVVGQDEAVERDQSTWRDRFRF